MTAEVERHRKGPRHVQKTVGQTPRCLAEQEVRSRQAACRAGPAATVTQPYAYTVNPPTLRIQVTPVAPGGAFNAAGANVNPAVPLFLPGVAIPQNQVAGPYDIDGGPLVMRSY